MRAFKFRLYPNKTQQRVMDQHLGYSKNLWNESLEHCKKFYSDFGFFPSKRTLEIFSKGSGLYSQAGLSVGHRLNDALMRFLVLRKKGVNTGFPRFKSIDRAKSICYPQNGFSLEYKLKVTPFGMISIRKHREVKGKIKTLTLKREASGKWFAIFAVEETSREPEKNKGPALGVDLGLLHFATLSNGSINDILPGLKPGVSPQGQIKQHLGHIADLKVGV
ncbi:transposase [Candidatus Micrarchaeota archaeon]|nr:transposase [Candidatus Micrarchaeota archaeon]